MSEQVVIALIVSAAGMITAFGALLAKLATVLQEINKIKITTSNLTQKLHHETAPNHGSSLKDSLNRIETVQAIMHRDISRLAEADIQMQDSKAHEHIRIWSTIDNINQRIQEHHGKNNGHQN